MQNKTNRWLDVQIVILALAMTFSLSLWNLFAGGSRSGNPVTASNPQGGTQSYSPAQPAERIYLGGAAPSTFSNAPAPFASTGSSRP